VLAVAGGILWYHRSGEVDWLDLTTKAAGAIGVVLLFLRWVSQPVKNFFVRLASSLDKIDLVDGEMKKFSTSLNLMALRQRFSFEHSDVPTYSCDENGEWIMANRALCELFGLPEEKMLGRGWTGAVHETDRRRVWEEWLSMRTALLPYSQTFRIVNQRTLAETVVRSMAVTHLDAMGAPVSYDGTVKPVGFLDALDLADGEAMLHEIAERLKQAAQTAGLENCASFDIRFANGDQIRVPLIPGGLHAVMPGVSMSLISQTEEATEYLLEVDGTETLPVHSHSRDETVTVNAGIMRDEMSGQVYQVGTTWHIPAEALHRVSYQSHRGVKAQVRGRITPPLPTVRQAGMDMRKIAAGLRN
jgi:PAS domain S-box-containing protein